MLSAPTLLQMAARPDVDWGHCPLLLWLTTDLQSLLQAAEDASFFLRRDGEGSDVYSRRIFRRVFTSDIERVLRMEVRAFPSKMWDNKKETVMKNRKTGNRKSHTPVVLPALLCTGSRATPLLAGPSCAQRGLLCKTRVSSQSSINLVSSF